MVFQVPVIQHFGTGKKENWKGERREKREEDGGKKEPQQTKAEKR